jgi:hypothetical protein
MVYELNLRMADELDKRFFLSVSPEEIEYYRQQSPLFGQEVEDKFPSMSEDISEAGKCLALGRSTACVFHLMRVMEIGLRRVGTAIGVALTASKNWQNILDEMNKRIRAMDQKDEKTKRYASASAHLYNVKLAWRNEVMHPKQTYTAEESKLLFSAVGVFIRDISNLVS